MKTTFEQSVKTAPDQNLVMRVRARVARQLAKELSLNLSTETMESIVAAEDKACTAQRELTSAVRAAVDEARSTK